MSSLILYTNPMSRGRIIRWMLEEIGVPYELRVIEFGEAMKTPEYLALNPMGKVPTLVHEGAVVTEVVAICAYLAERFPDAALAPPLGSPARAAWLRWLFFIAGPLEMAMTAKQYQWRIDKENAMSVGCGMADDALRQRALALRRQLYCAGSAARQLPGLVSALGDAGVQTGIRRLRGARRSTHSCTARYGIG